MTIMHHIKDSLLLFDGAMGTMLQQRGLKPGASPELLNITAPEVVTSVHREYVLAGVDVVTCNTFQANDFKLKGECTPEQAIAAGVNCAKASGARYTALDVGPLGQLIKPLGTISFEQAYEAYRKQMVAGEQAGADIVIIETISDLYEAKAAILAVTENTSLPVICSMTFQADGHTFIGCDALTAVNVLQGLGVDALGVNCSLGPDMLAPVVETMLGFSKVPVIVQANAGLPEMRGGQAVYAITPEQYASEVLKLVKKGVRIIGGCCGTSPEHIKLLRQYTDGLTPVQITPLDLNACSSGRKTVTIGNDTRFGEINPANPEVKKALLAGDYESIADEAISLVQDGAEILRINVAIPEINEKDAAREVLREIQGMVNVPLQIDSTDPDVTAAAMRIYNGI